MVEVVCLSPVLLTRYYPRYGALLGVKAHTPLIFPFLKGCVVFLFVCIFVIAHVLVKQGVIRWLEITGKLKEGRWCIRGRAEGPVVVLKAPHVSLKYSPLPGPAVLCRSEMMIYRIVVSIKDTKRGLCRKLLQILEILCSHGPFRNWGYRLCPGWWMLVGSHKFASYENRADWE